MSDKNIVNNIADFEVLEKYKIHTTCCVIFRKQLYV